MKLLALLLLCTAEGGILYPRDSETRETRSLDGIWNFALAPSQDPRFGHYQQWYRNHLSKVKNLDIHLMPVPSSYNDITTNSTIRDHVGVAWYDRTFFVPKSWHGKRVWLRFSSVSYAADVWLNGKHVMSHQVGHLPFQSEVTSLVYFGKKNLLTVACDNILTLETIPQGEVKNVVVDNGRRNVQTYKFDFFNYAGIHRPVTLYTTPKSYIDDVTVTTSLSKNTGLISYNISYFAYEKVRLILQLKDTDGKVVNKEESYGLGTLHVPNPKLWWPFLMHSKPGYLYTLQVELRSGRGELIDIYRQTIGIRVLAWNNNEMTINGKPIYFHGVGRHEDADIRGKGLDLPTLIRDHNLLKWIGVNAYRTTHYPYSEELMDLVDKLGIMIIDECPSVVTRSFTQNLLRNHEQALTEMVQRDKNRPSVVMWSVANEPNCNSKSSYVYFKEVVAHARNLDKTRPITAVVYEEPTKDNIMGLMDIVSINRYTGWYKNPGQIDMITSQAIDWITTWHNKYKRPIILMEYGADTYEGYHSLPDFIWSEEYQTTLLSRNFKAFDTLRKKKWFIGELVWNFADFKTNQDVCRAGGNKKGIFTRDRQPKSAAFMLRKRYFLLEKELHNVSLPVDLFDYTAKKYKR